jgi:hypothetical protein
MRNLISQVLAAEGVRAAQRARREEAGHTLIIPKPRWFVFLCHRQRAQGGGRIHEH